MKKYIAPELNVTKFDVEDVITTSIPTGNIYNSDLENKVSAKTVDFTEVFGN